jgi:2-iminoacetate synthase
MSDISKAQDDFIDDAYLTSLIGKPTDKAQFDAVLAKSMAKEALTIEECAVLINASTPEEIESIKEAARELKRKVYGNRIVLFAPIYIGNYCINDCLYCGFRKTNKEAVRRTLTDDELRAEIAAMEDQGQKRTIAVFGEHPHYDAKFIAHCVDVIYSVKQGKGEIRRININAAPLSVEDYKIVNASHIGTYQVFQETYHKETYAKYHPAGTRKSDYPWRLHALGRAMEAGIDDVGIGALYGLYDWRFEVLASVAHARHLQDTYGVGPHTISFPRIQAASGLAEDLPYAVSDEDYKRLVAILRLAVPYTGMIMTCRESAEIRKEVLGYGVSQIDAGTRLEIGGYADAGPNQEINREQFALGDTRSLDQATRELIEAGYIPSFCTACYRLGRTGEVFMEYAIPGFIQDYCTPNALTTLAEYLRDYGSAETKEAGKHLIAAELAKMPEGKQKERFVEDLRRLNEDNAKDVYV